MQSDILKAMPVEALLALHNKYASKKLKTFKGKKSELVDRTIKVMPTRNKGGPRGKTIKDLSLELLCLVDYYEDKTRDISPENRCEPKDKNARSVGLRYEEIDKRVREVFPLAKNQLGSLRWYVGKINDGEDQDYSDCKLPARRPRPRKKKEDGDA